MPAQSLAPPRKVVVVNGFHRTGSTRCFHTVRLILDRAGIAHRIGTGAFAVIDALIAEHRATAMPDWLVVKTHRWMPAVAEPDVIVLHTERNPRDVAISLHRARSRLPGPPDEVRARADTVAVWDAGWQALFARSCAARLPIERLRYEDYWGRDAVFVADVARLLGVALDDAAVASIVAEIAPTVVRDRTERMTEAVDPQFLYRRSHLSATLGRPGADASDIRSETFQRFLAEFDTLRPLRSPTHTTRPTGTSAAAGERQLRFLHLRKTGGTTLVRLLSDFFEPAQSADWRALRAAGTEEAAITAATRLAFVHGHGDHGDLARPDAFRFAFLREPLDRLRSDRRQWIEASEEDLAAMDEERAATVRVFRAVDFAGLLRLVPAHRRAIGCLWNHQTLALGFADVWRRHHPEARRPDVVLSPEDLFRSGEEAIDRLRAHDDELLDAAVARLRRLDHIGLFESFAASVADLLDRLGLPQPPAGLPRLNVRAPHADEDDPIALDLAEDFVALDRRLYAEAQALVRARAPAPSPRIDRIDRRPMPGAPIRLGPDDAPNGHGWHHPHGRGDGRRARWSSALAGLGLTAGAGRHRLTVEVYGIASPDGVGGVRFLANGRSIGVEARVVSADTLALSGEFVVETEGRLDLAVAVDGAVGGHGLEVAEIVVEAITTDPLGAMRPVPIDLSDVYVGEDDVHFGNRETAERRVYAWYAGYGAALAPTSLLEIGVRRGYGALAIARGAAGSLARYVGVDMELDLPGSNRAVEAVMRGLGVGEVTLIRADTREAFPRLSGGFDMIHVDGDHSTAGALGDLLAVLPLLAPDGTIVVDDVETVAVGTAVDIFLSGLGGRAATAEWGDLHRQVLIRPAADAPRRLDRDAVLAAAAPCARGRVRFDEALRVLRRLAVADRDEAGIAAAAADVVAAGWLRLTGVDRVPASPPTAAATIADFDALLDAMSQVAGAHGVSQWPWEAEYREHGGYALARLDGVPIPPGLAGTERHPAAFRPGTPSFAAMLHEAACNLAAIVERGLDHPVFGARIGT